MCYGCYIEAGSPTVMSQAVLAIAPRLRKADPYGACHIVVSDWNLEDEHIEFCRDEPEASDEDRTLMTDLLALSEDERHTAMALADGYIDEAGVERVEP